VAVKYTNESANCRAVNFLYTFDFPYTDKRVAQWLRCCATNRKVAGSIPDGVIGIFH